MANFDFLKSIKEYALFAGACRDAEKVFSTSPALCAVGCRKGLELAVKWVYSAEKLKAPYQDNLSAYLFDNQFKYKLVGYELSVKLAFIHKLGNAAVHDNKKVELSQALTALKTLFEFVQWIDFTYGKDYVKRAFDIKQIPSRVVFDDRALKAKDEELKQRDDEIAALRAKVEAMSGSIQEVKAENILSRGMFQPELSEFETRKQYIDLDLELLGWQMGVNIKTEVPV